MNIESIIYIGYVIRLCNKKLSKKKIFFFFFLVRFEADLKLG